jgi:predicted O-methyltransferase YrrM
MKKITPTKRSLHEVEYIVKNMEGHTFHHHFHILWDIRNMIDKEEINYLEIGTHSGGSACLMLRHPKKTNVFGMDLEESIRHEAVYSNVKKFKIKNNNFEYFIGNSRSLEVINSIRSKVGNVDMLFIDGEHSINAVIDDFLNYKDLVNCGGYIIFDDYNDAGYNPIVKHAVDMIVNEYLFDEYEVLGFIYNKMEATPNHMLYNNEFVLMKK